MRIIKHFQGNNKYGDITQNVHKFTKPENPVSIHESSKWSKSEEFAYEEIDTLAVARKTLQFMRTNGLTVTEFCEKVKNNF